MRGRFGSEYSPAQVWAVEDTSAQVTWGNLPAGMITARTGERETEVVHQGGPGAIDLSDLAPDREHTIELVSPAGVERLKARTLPSPPGQLLSRFATISDMHLGAVRWGLFKTMTDGSGHPVPYPYRCASAAVAEAKAWGAELLVIKGDAAQHETEADFDEVSKLVDEFDDLPMLLIPGNHDVDGEGGSIPLTIGRRKLPFTRLVDSVDLPGVRVAVADTTIAYQGRGSLVRSENALLDTVAGASGPSFVALHHQLQNRRLHRYWPIGISSTEATPFLRRLERIGAPVMISSGHTHRNRSRMQNGILISEVGSTKDWPCVWAGYAVHEGGIRQVVRRIAAPGAISWAEYSRRAVRGLWGLWSPGRLDERCLSHAWSRKESLV